MRPPGHDLAARNIRRLNTSNGRRLPCKKHGHGTAIKRTNTASRILRHSAQISFFEGATLLLQAFLINRDLLPVLRGKWYIEER
jgi:hypothetical protein